MLRVGLILPVGFHVMSYATVATFDTANSIAGEQFSGLSILSEHGRPVPNSFGAATETEPLDIKPFDTLLVGAGLAPTPSTPKLLTFLHEIVTNVRRVASICIGTFILAEAGILNGRRVTTHWAFARELERRYPKVRVEMDRIFIADGPVWTSAGMTAGIDMVLGLAERDMGGDIARATAKMMVVHHRRAGGQSPARAVECLRLKAARYMLKQGRLPVEEIARGTGFGDRERMRRSFLRTFGQTPQAMRNASHPLATI
jgi:transcriptional regulator GlxA family with amidase domain